MNISKKLLKRIIYYNSFYVFIFNYFLLEMAWCSVLLCCVVIDVCVCVCAFPFRVVSLRFLPALSLQLVQHDWVELLVFRRHNLFRRVVKPRGRDLLERDLSPVVYHISAPLQNVTRWVGLSLG